MLDAKLLLLTVEDRREDVLNDTPRIAGPVSAEHVLDLDKVINARQQQSQRRKDGRRASESSPHLVDPQLSARQSKGCLDSVEACINNSADWPRILPIRCC